jgi:hypothetical protein
MYNLFLDDFRSPIDAFQYTKDSDFLKLEWVIVRSHDEFVSYILERYKTDGSFPSIIAFDHDLADEHYDHLIDFPYGDVKEKTGMHSAKWLVDFCIDNDKILPDYKVHSQNPQGADNIKGLLSNFKKHQSS